MEQEKQPSKNNFGILIPSNGEIFIDKTNILKLSSNWWKEQIGYVPQNSELINSSIKDNIPANEKLNQQEISRLLETVGLGDNLKKSNLSFTDIIQENLSKGLKKGSLCKNTFYKSSNLYI